MNFDLNKQCDTLKEYKLNDNSLKKITGGTEVTGGILVGGGNVWCNSDEGNPPNQILVGHDCCTLNEQGDCEPAPN